MACFCATNAVRFSAGVQLPVQPFLCATDHLLLQEFSQWPTYPQLYVNGELLGGCDIVLEMQASVCRRAGGWGVCLLHCSAADAGKQALHCACRLAGAAASDLALPPWIQQLLHRSPLSPISVSQESGDLKAELDKARGAAPSLQERLKQLVNQQPVMLFMKVGWPSHGATAGTLAFSDCCAYAVILTYR